MGSSNKYSGLNKSFNIEDDSIDVEILPSTTTKKPSSDSNISEGLIDDIKKDYEYTRGNLYSIIEKGQEAINGIIELAQETEAPRAYEVAGQLIKSVSDATEKLMDLQKKLKDIDNIGNTKGPTNVTNALFVGSTAELSKLLKQNFNNDNEDV
jgi:hypothetical protein